MKTSMTSEYDYLFQHNIKNYVINIIIYNNDDQWSVEQHVDDKEHAIWKELYHYTYSLAYVNSIKMYKKPRQYIIVLIA